ncbi:hypothetical protein V2W45_1339474 [Cenococcum geophilum]
MWSFVGICMVPAISHRRDLPSFSPPSFDPTTLRGHAEAKTVETPIRDFRYDLYVEQSIAQEWIGLKIPPRNIVVQIKRFEVKEIVNKGKKMVETEKVKVTTPVTVPTDEFDIHQYIGDSTRYAPYKMTPIIKHESDSLKYGHCFSMVEM